jgi:hypothetical protein
MESALFAIVAEQQIESIAEKFGYLDPRAQYPLARAAGYMANARAFDQLNRQEGRLQRVLDRTTRELKALILSRVPPQPTERAAQTEAPVAQPEPAPTPETQTGFVPRKYPKHMPAFSGPQAKEHRRAWLRKNRSENLA